jgi:predicted HTH domain antitoxin
MPTIQFDFPPDVLSALRQSPEGFAREMRLAAAIHWYSQGSVSQEKAAQIAGLHRIDFLKELANRKVDVIQVDMDDLRRELDRG